jgi:hypothetical protein
MKRFALVAVLGLVGIAPAAEAGPLPRPISLVEKIKTPARLSHYVRAPRKLPRPVGLIESSKPSSFRPSHFVRGR